VPRWDLSDRGLARERGSGGPSGTRMAGLRATARGRKEKGGCGEGPGEAGGGGAYVLRGHNEKDLEGFVGIFLFEKIWL